MWDSEKTETGQQIEKSEGKKPEDESVEVLETECLDKEVKKEEVIASVWELLMHSRDHREALVLALDQKKISMGCTPKQMVGSLTRSEERRVGKEC